MVSQATERATSARPSRRRSAEDFTRALEQDAPVDDPALVPLLGLAARLRSLPGGAARAGREPPEDFRADLRDRLLRLVAGGSSQEPPPARRAVPGPATRARAAR